MDHMTVEGGLLLLQTYRYVITVQSPSALITTADSCSQQTTSKKTLQTTC